MVGGTVKSEPGFSPAFNGEFVGQGNDFIHMDPDEKRLRLDARGVIKYFCLSSELFIWIWRMLIMWCRTTDDAVCTFLVEEVCMHV